MDWAKNRHELSRPPTKNPPLGPFNNPKLTNHDVVYLEGSDLQSIKFKNVVDAHYIFRGAKQALQLMNMCTTRWDRLGYNAKYRDWTRIACPFLPKYVVLGSKENTLGAAILQGL